jgi:hypothetical protein
MQCLPKTSQKRSYSPDCVNQKRDALKKALTGHLFQARRLGIAVAMVQAIPF